MCRVVAIPIAVISLLALAGCGFEARRLDAQMEELCKKDGGIKVYETVTLPASDFNQFGEPLGRYIKPNTPQDERYGPDYRYVVREETIVDLNGMGEHGKGGLGRWYYALYRRADGKLLGESVLYQRGGGDMFTFGFEPSRNSCPRPRADLALSIFVKGE